MKSYTKKSIGYVVGVVGVTALILICRSNGVNASNDWNAIQASSSDRASRLRTFCRNWRETEYAAKARDLLKETVDNDFKKLGLTSVTQVKNFIRDYPEIHPSVVIEAQYKALVEKKSYRAYHEFYVGTETSDKYHDIVGQLIDQLVASDIEAAEKAQDVKKLRQLAKLYSDWKESSKIAEAKASAIQEIIDKKAAEEHLAAAKKEWDTLCDSKDDRALALFANRYSDTEYAKMAKERAECLYDDFDFVKEKNTIEAYRKYITRNPHGQFVAAANKRIIDLEVEDVARGDHGKLSAPHRSYSGYSGYGTVAKIALKNSTSYTIDVMYSGKVQSYKRSIEPNGSTTLSVTPGSYKVVVQAKGSDVRPFYGENDLNAGEYSEEFYIRTTRNGIPISNQSPSSFPNLNFPKTTTPQRTYPYRRSTY